MELPYFSLSHSQYHKLYFTTLYCTNCEISTCQTEENKRKMNAEMDNCNEQEIQDPDKSASIERSSCKRKSPDEDVESIKRAKPQSDDESPQAANIDSVEPVVPDENHVESVKIKEEPNSSITDSPSGVVKEDEEPQSSSTGADNGPATNKADEQCADSEGNKIKQEPLDEDAPTSNSIDTSAAAVKVKVEPADASTTATNSSDSNSPAIRVKVEPVDAATTAATSSTNSPAVDSSVSSSTLRPSCRFGIRCYRRNPAHRNNEAHPGDSDYRRPSFPAPPLGTPDCTFGNLCYRRNPTHFQQFAHPADFNSAQNIRSRLRQRRQLKRNSNDNVQASDSEEDPFAVDDPDEDFNPSDSSDDDDEEEDELEFDSQRVGDDDKFD